MRHDWSKEELQDAIGDVYDGVDDAADKIAELEDALADVKRRTKGHDALVRACGEYLEHIEGAPRDAPLWHHIEGTLRDTLRRALQSV